MKTYRYTAVAVALVAAGALAGCSTDPSGGGSKDPNATSLVASAVDSSEAALKFMKDAPEIDMQTAPVGTYGQVVATQLSGGTAADIIRTYPGNGSGLSLVQGAENGFYASLDDLDFVKNLSEADRQVLSSPDGHVIGVPTTVSAIGGV